MPHHWWKTSTPTLNSATGTWDVVLETTDATASKAATASLTIAFSQKGYFKSSKSKKMKKVQAEALAAALCSALNLLTAPD